MIIINNERFSTSFDLNVVQTCGTYANVVKKPVTAPIKIATHWIFSVINQSFLTIAITNIATTNTLAKQTIVVVQIFVRSSLYLCKKKVIKHKQKHLKHLL